MDEITPFYGFPESGIQFLHDLQKNNNREWFYENKSLFKEQLELPARAFANDIAQSLSRLTRSPMTFKLFRIYRDVRFSKDKPPYNTHIHISFYQAGEDKNNLIHPVFYIGLELHKIFCGCGFFTFSSHMLDQYRQVVAHTAMGRDLQKLLDKFQSQDGYVLQEPELKRIPSGFDKTHELGQLLRRKGLVIWHEEDFSDAVYQSDFADKMFTQLKNMKPLYDWLTQLRQNHAV